MTGQRRTFRGTPAEWLIEHEGDVSWHDAPAPPRRHKHHAQTVGQSPTALELVMRCPCGAFRRHDADGLSDWFLIDPPRVAPRRTIRQIIAGLRAGRK